MSPIAFSSMRVLSYDPIVRRITAWLFGSMLLLSYRPSGGDNLPPVLDQQLRLLRKKDDLTSWIYLQIQWVAKAPVNRSGWLQQTVNSAWRAPASNEEIQAWQD